MEITLKQAKEFVTNLERVPLDSVKKEIAFAIIDNILTLSPLAEQFDRVQKTASDKFFTEEYKQAGQILNQRLADYESEKNEKKRTEIRAEIKELEMKANNLSAPFIEIMDEYLHKAYNEDKHEVVIKTIDKDLLIESLQKLQIKATGMFYKSISLMFQQ